MIKVSRLNGSQYILNSELIEFLEATPDTVVTLTTGKKVVVLENVDDIIESVVKFRRRILPQVLLREDLMEPWANDQLAADEEATQADSPSQDTGG